MRGGGLNWKSICRKDRHYDKGKNLNRTLEQSACAGIGTSRIDWLSKIIQPCGSYGFGKTLQLAIQSNKGSTTHSPGWFFGLLIPSFGSWMVFWAFNTVFWVFLLPFFTPMEYSTGFIAFTVIILMRLCANLYSNNVLKPEQFESFPFRIPLNS